MSAWLQTTSKLVFRLFLQPRFPPLPLPPFLLTYRHVDMQRLPLIRLEHRIPVQTTELLRFSCAVSWALFTMCVYMLIYIFNFVFSAKSQERGDELSDSGLDILRQAAAYSKVSFKSRRYVKVW